MAIQKKFLFLLTLLMVTPAYANDADTLALNQMSLSYGPVRENDGTAYRAFRIDDRLSTHFEGVLGGIIGGDIPPNTGSKFDYRTFWVGGEFIEVEDYLDGGMGLVRLSRQTTHLTSPYQFIISFGTHLNAWSITYVHLSNGHTGGKNYGEDMLLFGYGF